MRFFIATVALLLLAGCGTTQQLVADRAAQASFAAYKACLDEHSDNASPCRDARLTYETDRAKADQVDAAQYGNY
ncbi:MAG: hypothetical protein WCA81_00290 [Rhizomicrobium sp.]